MKTLERSLKKMNKLRDRTEVFLVNHCTPRKLFQPPNNNHTSPGSSTSSTSSSFRGRNSVSIEDEIENDDHKNEDQNDQTSNKDNSPIPPPRLTSSLPLQIRKKFLSKPFEFTIMVVGHSGLGKSTLLNQLFSSNIYDNGETSISNDYLSKEFPPTTSSIRTTEVNIKEKSVSLNLTLIDTPGFGDCLDNSNCWLSLLDYIEQQNQRYFLSELQIRQRNVVDKRVHCCLYFIEPTNRPLKTIDIECMKRLHQKVNLIPLIAKADSLTKDELNNFKHIILKTIKENKIKIYSFPTEPIGTSSSLDDYINLLARVPFAVIGANASYQCSQEKVDETSTILRRCREYPWGRVEVDNLDHCDFAALSHLLLHHSMIDLVQRTAEIYELYRIEQLTTATGASSQSSTTIDITINDIDKALNHHEEDDTFTVEVDIDEEIENSILFTTAL